MISNFAKLLARVFIKLLKYKVSFPYADFLEVRSVLVSILRMAIKSLTLGLQCIVMIKSLC